MTKTTTKGQKLQIETTTDNGEIMVDAKLDGKYIAQCNFLGGSTVAYRRGRTYTEDPAQATIYSERRAREVVARLREAWPEENWRMVPV